MGCPMMAPGGVRMETVAVVLAFGGETVIQLSDTEVQR